MRYISTISKSFWFQFLPAWIFGLLTIGLLITGVIPSYYLIGTFIMWVLVCGLGIAVGYHRVFSHRTYQLPSWKENIILFFAVFAGQGGSIVWAALHRGYHHPYSDTIKDFHSPIAHNKRTAFVGWYFQMTEEKNPINIRYAVDLLKKRNHVFFSKNVIKILWAVPAVVAVFDWKLALTSFWLVTFIGSTQDNLVNVFGHIKGYIGYRNFNTKDNSHNNPILAYLTWGQAWHNNHHYDPKSYDFGSGISGKWWEFDPCRLWRPFLNA